MSETTAPAIKAIECRFAVYCKSKEDRSDLHLVKEQVTFEDGTQRPRIRFIKDYKRSVYITHKGKQNYKDYKEWELKENLIEFRCTQTELADTVAKGLGTPWAPPNLRQLCASPYVYGADILSTSLIKQEVAEKYPNVVTPFTLAAFDTETDMVHGHGQIIMAGISFKTRMYIAIQADFLVGYANPIPRIQELLRKYIGEVIDKRQIVFDIEIKPNEIEVVKATIAKAHQWAPDWLAAWNMAFDLDKVLAACDRAGVDPADLLSDPSVPAQYRFFKFKKGNAKKTTAAGRTMNFKPSQQWHTVFCPSSFYWIDAMCAYRQVRQGSAEEVSYGLDHILKKNKIGGKLKFEPAAHVEEDGAAWHNYMQKNHPLEYVVYHAYDCIAMEILDEKTKDLQMALPNFAGYTDFQHFPSLPKKSMNDLHFFIANLEQPRVPGSTAAEMSTDHDDMTTDVKGWIVMLPSHCVADNGLKIIEENPELRTNIRIGVADLDIEGAYPTNELVANVSKETTSKELIKVEGISDQAVRMQTLNFSGGKANAVEWCTTMYGMPTLSALLPEFQAFLAASQVPIETTVLAELP